MIIPGKGGSPPGRDSDCPPLRPAGSSPKQWVLPCLLPRERRWGQVGAQRLHLHKGPLAVHAEGLAPPELSGCVTRSPACVMQSPELRGCHPPLSLSDLPPRWCPHGGCGPRGPRAERTGPLGDGPGSLRSSHVEGWHCTRAQWCFTAWAPRRAVQQQELWLPPCFRHSHKVTGKCPRGVCGDSEGSSLGSSG